MAIIEELYFDWMYDMMCRHGCHDLEYRSLFAALHNTQFRYSIPRDANRVQDGIKVRYLFADATNITPDTMSALYSDKSDSCSVLELMVGLAIRCEESIMTNADYGQRTSRWFWDMVISLGLHGMDDRRFNRRYVQQRVNDFLDRNYEPNGAGGLFTVYKTSKDLRDVEIWYQMCWYLNDILKGE